jgi:hypothetical protein
MNGIQSDRTDPPQRRTPEVFSRLQGVQKAELPDTIKQSLAALMVPGFDTLVNRKAITCPSNQ